MGQQLQEDVFADDLLAAVKTVNHHASDGKYNQATLKKANGHLAALRRLRQADDPDVREMAETYIGWIERVQAAARDKAPIAGRFETYLKKRAAPRRRRKDVPFTVRRTKVLQPRRELKNGELVVVDGAADNKALFGGRSIQGRAAVRDRLRRRRARGCTGRRRTRTCSRSAASSS